MVTSWPFVGRRAEIQYVEKLLNAGVGALLVGEQGVGKSALAREVGSRQAAAGATVAYVLGRAASSLVPYEPFAAILGGLASIAAPAHPHEVATLLRDAWRPHPQQPALIILDDAHLLDEVSARVLTFLADESGLRFVLTAATGHALPAPVERLWLTGTCRRIEVTGLIDADVGEAMETALGGPVEPRTVRTFATRTRGNGLLLRELTVTAVTRDALRLRCGIWAIEGDPPLSESIRALVVDRLADVDPTLLNAAETIAAGEPLDIRIARKVLGDEVLEALEAARLVAVRANGATSVVTTVHPIAGDVVRSGTPVLRQRRLRLDLARAIEGQPSSMAHDLVRSALWRVEAGQVGDPQRLMRAARAARAFSLDTAEHLARAAYEAHGTVDATLLLAEVYTHTNRRPEAAALLATLPAESLRPEDREAIIYCTAMAQGLLGGDLAGAAELVAGVAAGGSAASKKLPALYSAMLAFDARNSAALEAGLPLLDDPDADAVARTFAGIGVVSSLYWLGRTTSAIRHAEAVLPFSEAVRDAAPFGPPTLRLMTSCALADAGRFDEADEYAQKMRVDAAARDDEWAEPRATYCLGRVALMRGRPRTARQAFQRCIGIVGPLDRSFLRHLGSMVARAAALSGDITAATAALDLPPDIPRITAYEAEWDLARAAVLAAEMELNEAVELASWVASVAAGREQWSVVLTACHDAARYGGAKCVVARAEDAAGRIDGELARCLVDRIRGLVKHDGTTLDDVSLRLQALGSMLYAAETAAEAAIAHGGLTRTARASGARFERLRAECEDATFAWLTPLTPAEPLTPRERQIARLAARGAHDNDIARRLGISARTVQTHLARAYAKLGVRGRGELADLFD